MVVASKDRSRTLDFSNQLRATVTVTFHLHFASHYISTGSEPRISRTITPTSTPNAFPKLCSSEHRFQPPLSKTCSSEQVFPFLLEPCSSEHCSRVCSSEHHALPRTTLPSSRTYRTRPRGYQPASPRVQPLISVSIVFYISSIGANQYILVSNYYPYSSTIRL
jgi:hypothetical protein